MSETSDAGRMVQAYLASKGMQPTSENVSRALQMNAQNPGLISGLVNQAPDSAASASVPQPQPQSPNGIRRAMQMPQPPQPPQASVSIGEPQVTQPAEPSVLQATQPPIAQAPVASDGMSNTAMLGLGGGAAATLYALSKLLPQGTPPDPNPPPNVSEPAPPDPMQAAMDKAVAPNSTKPPQPVRTAPVDDGISVPSPEAMTAPKPSVNTPSSLLRERQHIESVKQLNPSQSLDIAEIMRNSQTNPDGVGKLLHQLATGAGKFRGFRP